MASLFPTNFICVYKELFSIVIFFVSTKRAVDKETEKRGLRETEKQRQGDTDRERERKCERERDRARTEKARKRDLAESKV